MNALRRRPTYHTVIAIALAFGIAASAWAQADLTVQSVSAECAINSLLLSVDIANDGASRADGFDIALFLSIDDTIEPTDVLLVRTRIRSLGAESDDTIAGTVRFPDVVAGTYTIGAIIDPDNVIPESDETNNVFQNAAITLPCLFGEPDIHIQKLHVVLTQDAEKVPHDSGYATLETAPLPTMFIARVTDETSRDATRALVAHAGAMVVDYPYLPAHSTLFRGGVDAADRVRRDPRVVHVFAASAAIVAGEPTVACPIDPPGIGSKFAISGYGWDGVGAGSASLRFHINHAEGKLPPEDLSVVVDQALALWATNGDLEFMETDRAGLNRSIDISWARRDHGDGTPFDGFGGIVAHSFYPEPIAEEPLAGDLHLDSDENWTITPGLGLHAFSVVLHEIGHCLGLNHSEDPNAVMYPQIRFADAFTTLDDDDIEGLRKLYAPPPGANAFNINNTGDNILAITDILPEDAAPWVSVLPAPPFQVLPKTTQEVQVIVNYAAAPVGLSTTRLRVLSDDDDESPYPGGVFVDIDALDTRPPSVVIGAPTVTLTREGPVSFTVAFPGADEVALGAADVVIHATGTATATAYVDGSGNAERTVTLDTVSGDGAIQIAILEGIASNMHGLSSASADSDPVVVDNTPPTVALEQPTYDAATQTVHLIATYSEAAAINLGANHIQLDFSGTAGAVVTVQGNGLNHREITVSNFEGDGSVALTVLAGTAQDLAGNPAGASNRLGPIALNALSLLPPHNPGAGGAGCRFTGNTSPLCDILVAGVSLALLLIIRRNVARS